MTDDRYAEGMWAGLLSMAASGTFGLVLMPDSPVMAVVCFVMAAIGAVVFVASLLADPGGTYSRDEGEAMWCRDKERWQREAREDAAMGDKP